MQLLKKQRFMAILLMDAIIFGCISAFVVTISCFARMAFCENLTLTFERFIRLMQPLTVTSPYKCRVKRKTKNNYRRVKTMTYFEMVKADLLEAINNGDYSTEDYRGDRDGFEEMLNDEAWIDDSITGNASGSYYCNSWKAKEAVLADMETVIEALREFCCDPSEIGERFLNEDWEWLDVTARCYVLGSAVYEVCDELEAAGAFDEIEEETENTIFESVVSVVADAVPVSGAAVQNPEVSNA